MDAVGIAVEVGPLTSPKISMWQAIGGLLRNAFFKAILPGLEHERASP
jgi:hypothetical protein